MKTLNFSRQKKHQSAFTLIEIMVATVVMIVLTGLVIQITSEVLKVWNRSSGKLSANAEARIAMDLLTQDLETAVFRNNGQRWLEARQLDLGDPLTGGNFKTTQLRLFSPVGGRVASHSWYGSAPPGDPTVVWPEPLHRQRHAHLRERQRQGERSRQLQHSRPKVAFGD